MEPLEEIFRANIARLIADSRLKEVSALSGVPYRSLQNALKGMIPQAPNLQKLADFWGIRPDELLQPRGVKSPGAELLADELAKRNARIKALEAKLAEVESQQTRIKDLEIKLNSIDQDLLGRIAKLSPEEQSSIEKRLTLIERTRNSSGASLALNLKKKLK